MCLSQLEFSALLAYAPHGHSQRIQHSKDVMLHLKKDAYVEDPPILMSQWVAKTILENLSTLEFASFFNVRAIKTAHIMEDWINEISLLDLTKKYGTYHGGIAEAMAGSASWILGSFLSVADACDFHLRGEFRSHIVELNKRVRYGVKTDRIDLIYLLDGAIGRSRAKELVEEGFKNLTSLIEVPIENLEKIVRDRRIALFIKKKALEAEKDEFLRSRNLCLIRAEELGIDKRIIRSLYDDPHGPFTDAVRQILTHINITNELFPVTDESLPDRKIPVSNGAYVIEIKSPPKRRKIRSREAGEIAYKKLGVDEKILGAAVIGRTEFDERVYPMAEKGGFSLVTAPTLQEIFFDFIEKKITKEQVLSILFKPGLVNYEPNTIRESS